jgi:NAD(P)-dependent dehydrogenase (short-subunit alcohol dehydrogenase family)
MRRGIRATLTVATQHGPGRLLPRRPDLAGRDEVLLQSVAGEVEKIGSRAHALMCDVGVEEDVRGLFRETIRVFGPLDLLFNNAGIAAPAVPLEELSLESWSNVVATNLTGGFLCTARHSAS